MSAPQPAAPAGRRLIVAVDGPSGSGKSSVSREVARRLGLEYLDTGAMYRAVTWSALHAGLDLDDTAAVAAHVRALDLRTGTDPTSPSVAVGTAEGVVDVAEAIRTTEISSVVSKVAVNLEVRAELHRRQRALIAAACDGPCGGVVAEGRDITTVVAPQAQVRLLLTASEAARVARRARDLHGSAEASAMAATTDQVVRRDADDSRVAQFLTAADGVTHLDSSDLDFEQTVEAVLRLVGELSGHRAVQPPAVLDPVR